MYIKQMQLCDTRARSQTNLKGYRLDIEASVSKVMPGATVEINEKYFTIFSDEPKPIPKL